jgi:hypothetical protein
MADEEQPAPELDLAGYQSVEQLAAGYRASSEEGKRQRERADRLEREHAALMEALTQQQATPRQEIPNRPARPEDTLLEYGVPADAVQQLVNQSVREALQPLTRATEARRAMIAKNRDYLAHEQDIANWISADAGRQAEYEKEFVADPELAMAHALHAYASARWSAMQGSPAPGRVDARIPSSRTGEGRRDPSPDSAIQNAFERFQKTGSQADALAYAKARLRTVVTDKFLTEGMM